MKEKRRNSEIFRFSKLSELKVFPVIIISCWFSGVNTNLSKPCHVAGECFNIIVVDGYGVDIFQLIEYAYYNRKEYSQCFMLCVEVRASMPKM